MTGLVKKIEDKVRAASGKNPRTLGAYVIFDTNSSGLDGRLRTLAEKEGLKHVAFGIGALPGDYSIDRRTEVTVVIYAPGRRNNKVTANFALCKGELDTAKADAIAKALAEVLPK